MSVVSGRLIEVATEPFRCFSGLLALPLPFKTVCFFIVMFGAAGAHRYWPFRSSECPSHYMLEDGVCCDSIGTVCDASVIKLDRFYNGNTEKLEV